MLVELSAFCLAISDARFNTYLTAYLLVVRTVIVGNKV